jgi:hypothetical protein
MRASVGFGAGINKVSLIRHTLLAVSYCVMVVFIVAVMRGTMDRVEVAFTETVTIEVPGRVTV